MFVMTMNRSALRRIGAAALCAAALAAGAAGLYSLTGQNAVETAASPAAELKITGAQDVQTFFAGYGVQVDPSAAEVSQVKVPRKWDDSFEAFHDVVRQSGLDLSKCKNRTVDKWMVPVPAMAAENEQTYAVVLVYREQARGAYYLKQPSGEVLPMTPPAQTPAASSAAPQTAAATQETAVTTQETAATQETAVTTQETAVTTQETASAASTAPAPAASEPAAQGAVDVTDTAAQETAAQDAAAQDAAAQETAAQDAAAQDAAATGAWPTE